MKIECTIDYTEVSENMNSQMPLSYLIEELSANEANFVFHDCDGGKCGKCLVYIENEGIMPSCIIPVFTINGKHIITQDAYLEKDIAADVQNAFKILKISPCKDCYKSKVMLFGYIVEKLIERENIVKQEGDKSGNEPTIRDNIIDSCLRMSSCSCILKSDIYLIIDTILKIRRNHLV